MKSGRDFICQEHDRSDIVSTPRDFTVSKKYHIFAFRSMRKIRLQAISLEVLLCLWHKDSIVINLLLNLSCRI